MDQALDPDLVSWAQRAASSKWSADELIAAWLDEGFTNEVPSHNWRPGKKATSRKSITHTLVELSRRIPKLALRSDVNETTLAELTELGDAVEQAKRIAVEQLRAKGYSWSEIADQLGLQRSAVIRKYGPQSKAAA